MRMHCFLDFGNSRIKAWLCQNGAVISRLSYGHRLDIRSFFDEIPTPFQQAMDFVGVTSVLNSEINDAFVEDAIKHWGVRPQFAESKACQNGISNGYVLPSQLGVDRWMNILAVSGEERAVCVVSCGTALTIDLIEHGIHVGGYILPGMMLQYQSLLVGTQKVRPELTSDSCLSPGRSTTEGVNNGILLGQVSVVEYCFRELQQRIGGACRLILTGGDAEKLAPHLSCHHDIIPELVLIGLQRYFQYAVSTD